MPKILLAIILISLAVFIVLFGPKVISKQSVNLVPTITPTLSPSPSPTQTPTPTPSPTPKPISTATLTPKPQTPKPTSNNSIVTEKGNFSATVMYVDLNSARMVTDTANDSDCSNNCNVLTLQDFVNRNAGFLGVNGTYFCPATYPECASKTNSFDFPVFNTRLGHWINGGNLFWNGRSMVYFDGGGAHFVQDAKSFSGGLTAGIVNYPGLVNGGSVQIDDNQSGLSDKQKARGTKVGIGVKDSRTVMVVVAQSVNMQEFAYVFKALGATGALNLDTGGSTALYSNGRYLAGPGRDIPNAIIFVR